MQSRITYQQSGIQCFVLLSGKIVGEIIKIDNKDEYGYRYFPMAAGVTAGELFTTLPECKKSLEE